MSRKKHKKHRSPHSVKASANPQKNKKKRLAIVILVLLYLLIIVMIGIFKNIFVALELLFFTVPTVLMGYLSYWMISELIENIQIFRKGERFDGICTGWRMSGKTHVVQVSWKQEDIQHFMEFDALRQWKKFPYPVKVYRWKETPNLGIDTLIPLVFYAILVISGTVFYGGTIISLLLI